MSLRAMLWTLEDAPVTDPTSLLVLIGLAERADENGRNAWPSRQWLAERARCSVRTVQRHLNALLEAGVIREGDQRYVAHLRGGYRPVVYDLVMDIAGWVARAEARERGDELTPRSRGDDLTPLSGDNLAPLSADESPETAAGVTPVAGRGDTGGHRGVTTVSLNTSLNPPRYVPKDAREPEDESSLPLPARASLDATGRPMLATLARQELAARRGKASTPPQTPDRGEVTTHAPHPGPVQQTGGPPTTDRPQRNT